MQNFMRIIRVIRAFLVLLQHGSSSSDIRQRDERVEGSPV